MSKITELKVVKASALSKLTKRIRKALFNAVAKETKYDGIQGYALVTWDERGKPGIYVWAGGSGPIALERMPSYVHDQLLRYVMLDDRQTKTISETNE